MDSKPYKVVEDLYRLFKESEGHLTEKQIGYVTGAFKTLLDLYWEDTAPEEVPEPGFDMNDLNPFRRKNI